MPPASPSPAGAGGRVQREVPAAARGVQPRLAPAARSGEHGEPGRRAEPGVAPGHLRGRARSAAKTRARSLPPGEPPAPLSPPAQQPGPVRSPSRRRGPGGSSRTLRTPLPPCRSRPAAGRFRSGAHLGSAGRGAPGPRGRGCVSAAALPPLRTRGRGDPDCSPGARSDPAPPVALSRPRPPGGSSGGGGAARRFRRSRGHGGGGGAAAARAGRGAGGGQVPAPAAGTAAALRPGEVLVGFPGGVRGSHLSQLLAVPAERRAGVTGSRRRMMRCTNGRG